MNIENRIAQYLNNKKRLTLWTWIKYFEKSKEPKHCTRLRNNMKNALNAMVHQGIVATCRSVKGKRSYRRLPDGVPF